jgi:hypothetical protein
VQAVEEAERQMDAVQEPVQEAVEDALEEPEPHIHPLPPPVYRYM